MYKMANYGEIIYDSSKDGLYNLFTQYFSNPVMTKIKDTDLYSMYIAKINAQLGIEFRYIIVFIWKDDSKVGTEEKLESLKWVSLQTRTLKDEYKLNIHSYIPSRSVALGNKITLVHKDNKQYRYTVENLPIIVTLLPTEKGIEYNSSGNLISALETYQTIISVV